LNLVFKQVSLSGILFPQYGSSPVPAQNAYFNRGGNLTDYLT